MAVVIFAVAMRDLRGPGAGLGDEARLLARRAVGLLLAVQHRWQLVARNSPLRGEFAIDARSTSSLGLLRSAPDSTCHRVLQDDLRDADIRPGNGSANQYAGSGMRTKFRVPVSVTAIKSSIPH